MFSLFVCVVACAGVFVFLFVLLLCQSLLLFDCVAVCAGAVGVVVGVVVVSNAVALMWCCL